LLKHNMGILPTRQGAANKIYDAAFRGSRQGRG
jgi:hypothetical protein